MAIRETWNRIIRKSASSTSSSNRSSDDGQYSSAVATVLTPNLPKPNRTSRLGKIASFRSTASSSANANKPNLKMPRESLARDPSKRKLTSDNLRHQEVLGTFTMKFGRKRRLSRGTRSSISQVSPGCSRAGSLDLGRAGSTASGEGSTLSPGSHADMRRMSLFWWGPWEEREEERIAEESS